MQLKNFFTPLESLNFNTKVSHRDEIISVGSCFASEIGNRLKDLEFNITVNPFGTIFNPVSIFNLLLSCISDSPVNKEQIVTSNGLFYHYLWHSSIYGTSQEELLSKIEIIQSAIKTKLKSSNVLILTFGTSIVHEFENNVVANCHKQSRSLFNKRFLDLDELKKGFNVFNTILKEYNPNLRIITTTSPVRHTKEGLIDNSRSKALLNVFNHHLSETYTHIEYFPSYEILMDVLRDYRFFKSDLIHPTNQAVDEIWSNFYTNVITPESYTYIKQMEKYNQMKNHTLLFPESESGKQFLFKKEQLYKDIQQLK